MAEAKRACRGSNSSRPFDSQMSEACAGCRMAKVRCERLIPCLRCLRRNERCVPQHHSGRAGGSDAGVGWQRLLQPQSVSKRRDAHAMATEVLVRRAYRHQLEGKLAVHKARHTLAAISHAQSHTGLDLFPALLPSLARVCGLQPMSGSLPTPHPPTHTAHQPPPPQPLLSQDSVRQLAHALNVPSCAEDDLAVAVWPIGGHSCSVNRVFGDTFVRGSAIHTLLHNEALAAPYMVSWLFELPDQDAFLHALADLLFSSTDMLQLQLRATDKHSAPLTCSVFIRLLQSPNSCGSMVMAMVTDRTRDPGDVASVLHLYTPADDLAAPSDISLIPDRTELREDRVELCVVPGSMGMGAGRSGISASVEGAVCDLKVQGVGMRGGKRSRERSLLLQEQQGMPLLKRQQSQQLQRPPYHHPQPHQGQHQQQQSSCDQPQQHQRKQHQSQQPLVGKAVGYPSLGSAAVHNLQTELPHISPQEQELLLALSLNDLHGLQLPQHQITPVSQQQQQQQQQLTPLLLQQQQQSMAAQHGYKQQPVLMQQESTPVSIASNPTTASTDSALTTIASTPSLSSSCCPPSPPPLLILNTSASAHAHSDPPARGPNHSQLRPNGCTQTHPSGGYMARSGLFMPISPPAPLVLAQDCEGRTECVTEDLRAGGYEMGLQGALTGRVLIQLDDRATETMVWL